MMRYLNVKSYYSFLSSTLSIDDIVSYAVNNKYDSIALTDDSNMCGCLEFINKCNRKGIKPIVGMEVWVSFNEDKEKYILLAKDMDGYRNLMYITSVVSFSDGNKSIAIDDIRI